MRITNNILVSNMINYMGTNLQRLDKYQQQIATGKKISVPSDDPIVASRSLKLRTDVSEIEQYKRNVDDASSWMEITESSLSNMTDILQRARELTVQGSNGTNTPDDTAKIAKEMEQLKRQAIHIGNATYAGRYIFSGYKTDTPVIDEATGAFNVDVENTETIRYEIGIGDDININVTGGEIFNNGSNAVVESSGTSIGDSGIASLDIVAGVNDILNLTVDGEAVSITIPAMVYANNDALAAAIQTEVNNATATAVDISVSLTDGRLSFTSGSQGDASSIVMDGTSSAAAGLGLTSTTQVDGSSAFKGKLIEDFDRLVEALNIGDITTIGSTLKDLDIAINNILRIRADVGSRMNRLELTENRLMSDGINFTKLMSENEDIDMSEAIINLKNEENVYKASLSGGARIIMPTLLDFLR